MVYLWFDFSYADRNQTYHLLLDWNIVDSYMFIINCCFPVYLICKYHVALHVLMFCRVFSPRLMYFWIWKQDDFLGLFLVFSCTTNVWIAVSECFYLIHFHFSCFAQLNAKIIEMKAVQLNVEIIEMNVKFCQCVWLLSIIHLKYVSIVDNV